MRNSRFFAFSALVAFDAPGTLEKKFESDLNPLFLIEYIHRNRLVVDPALLLYYYRKKMCLM